MSDRTVHSSHPAGEEIVRYDRSGKWYIELVEPSQDAPLRKHIGVGEAARQALLNERNGGKVFLGLPGGRAFERKLSALRASRLRLAGCGKEITDVETLRRLMTAYAMLRSSEDYDWSPEGRVALDRLVAQLRDAQEALDRYGSHLSGCRRLRGSFADLPECDCGWDAALSSVRARSEM